jgi:hypothetical protein
MSIVFVVPDPEGFARYLESLRTPELSAREPETPAAVEAVSPLPKTRFPQTSKTSRKQAILTAIDQHRAELGGLGRNDAARYLADLGLGEAYARKILTEQRRAETKRGDKKVVPGEIIHLSRRQTMRTVDAHQLWWASMKHSHNPLQTPPANPTKAGWRPKEWARDVSLCTASVYNLLAQQPSPISSVKHGRARIITTSPAEYLASLPKAGGR